MTTQLMTCEDKAKAFVEHEGVDVSTLDVHTLCTIHSMLSEEYVNVVNALTPSLGARRQLVTSGSMDGFAHAMRMVFEILRLVP